MLKKVYEINKDGTLKEIYVATIDNNGKIVDEDKKDFIVTDFPAHIFKPKWDGARWIENATKEELEYLTRDVEYKANKYDVLLEQNQQLFMTLEFMLTDLIPNLMMERGE